MAAHRLVEQGSQERVIAHGGPYARLDELQFLRAEHASPGAFPAAVAFPAE